MTDRIGTEIAGYRIESLLARGGMGEVYLANRLRHELHPHGDASDELVVLL